MSALTCVRRELLLRACFSHRQAGIFLLLRFMNEIEGSTEVFAWIFRIRAILRAPLLAGEFRCLSMLVNSGFSIVFFPNISSQNKNVLII